MTAINENQTSGTGTTVLPDPTERAQRRVAQITAAAIPIVGGDQVPQAKGFVADVGQDHTGRAFVAVSWRQAGSRFFASPHCSCSFWEVGFRFGTVLPL